MNNKNQLATTTGTGVALKNASKSLKITNKLLAELDDFDKNWQWWLSLDDVWRIYLLKDGLQLEYVDYDWDWNDDLEKYDFITNINIDWYDKNLMKKYIQQIISLNEINLSCKRIFNISPLRRLTNLTQLLLDNNEILDISALANCKKISILTLDCNQITDISALANLNNLTWVNLSYNQITDISALQNLANLTKVGLENNQITDLSPLANLKRLEFIKLNDNPISQLSNGIADMDNYLHMAWLQKQIPNCKIFI